MATPEPPACASGWVYKSTEARCMGCEVHGGPEEVCIRPETIGERLEKTGYPCPYRPPATPDDGALVRLVNIGASPDFGHIFSTYFSELFSSRPARERRQRARMVTSALLNPQISEIIARDRDRAREDSSPENGRR